MVIDLFGQSYRYYLARAGQFLQEIERVNIVGQLGHILTHNLICTVGIDSNFQNSLLNLLHFDIEERKIFKKVRSILADSKQILGSVDFEDPGLPIADILALDFAFRQNHLLHGLLIIL